MYFTGYVVPFEENCCPCSFASTFSTNTRTVMQKTSGHGASAWTELSVCLDTLFHNNGPHTWKQTQRRCRESNSDKRLTWPQEDQRKKVSILRNNVSNDRFDSLQGVRVPTWAAFLIMEGADLWWH